MPSSGMGVLLFNNVLRNQDSKDGAAELTQL